MKIKYNLDKPVNFFLLKLTLFNACHIPNGIIINYVTPWRFWTSKILNVKINKRYNELLKLTENILSIQSVVSFLYMQIQETLIFLLSTLLKLSEK